MAGRFKLPQWVYPLLIAALVAVFGWWGNYRLRDTIEQELKTQLTAALDANVTALEIWTTNQLQLASSLAGDPVVRDFGSAILEQPPLGGFSQTSIDAEQFAIYLRSRLNMMGYATTAQLVNKNFEVVVPITCKEEKMYYSLDEQKQNLFTKRHHYKTCKKQEFIKSNN